MLTENARRWTIRLESDGKGLPQGMAAEVDYGPLCGFLCHNRHFVHSVVAIGLMTFVARSHYHIHAIKAYLDVCGSCSTFWSYYFNGLLRGTSRRPDKQ